MKGWSTKTAKEKLEAIRAQLDLEIEAAEKMGEAYGDKLASQLDDDTLEDLFGVDERLERLRRVREQLEDADDLGNDELLDRYAEIGIDTSVPPRLFSAGEKQTVENFARDILYANGGVPKENWMESTMADVESALAAYGLTEWARLKGTGLTPRSLEFAVRNAMKKEVLVLGKADALAHARVAIANQSVFHGSVDASVLLQAKRLLDSGVPAEAKRVAVAL